MITLYDIRYDTKFNLVCSIDELSDDVIDKYFGNFDVEILCICQKLSCDVMDKHFDILCNYAVFYRYQMIPSTLIDKYQHLIIWEYLSASKNANLYTFNKYKDFLHFESVLVYGDVPLKHLHKYKINFALVEDMLDEPDITDEIRNRCMDFLDSDLFKLEVDRLQRKLNI